MKDMNQYNELYNKLISTHAEFLENKSKLFQQFIHVSNVVLKQPNTLSPNIKQNENVNNVNPLSSSYTYNQLVTHAVGKIADVFGVKYKKLDNFNHRIRLPGPPFLFVDRIIEMSADPENKSLGQIISETDLNKDKWYMHDEYIPLGFLFEANHGHMFLMSWLGFDFNYEGNKVYRLLGGSAVFHRGLPKMGDIIRYQTRLHNKANYASDIYSIESDCYVKDQLILSIKARVGMFSEVDLNSSIGVTYDPINISNTAPVVVSPIVSCQYSSFSNKQIQALANGDIYSCFGKGFESAQTHIYSPRIRNERLLLFDEINEFHPHGGPRQCGYLRAIKHISPDDWFFKCHFINDAVMPGSLSIEAAFQLMAFYLSGLGCTLDKDSWRFDIVTEKEFTFQARGQVLPTTKGITYEVFVEELILEPYPTLTATILTTTFDGIKIYKLSHLRVQLLPDHPLTRLQELLPLKQRDKRAFVDSDGIIHDLNTLTEYGIGVLSRACGDKYQIYDYQRNAVRPPAPSFLFITRIVNIKGEKSGFQTGTEGILEYDIPSDAWYFTENDQRVMPFCVLNEAALQSLGYIGAYIGTCFKSKEDIYIRNLGGTMKIENDVLPDTGSIITEGIDINNSIAGDKIIETFQFKCYSGQTPICSGESTFGFFTKEALKQQVGLKTNDDHTSLLKLDSNIEIDFNNANYHKHSLSLPLYRLKILDRVTGFWRQGGESGLGLLRAEKDIHPSDWFFKAHFYKDPVQPGSLGLEGMLQLLKYYLMEQSGWENFVEPYFESPATGSTINWKYRGQVLSHHDKIIYTMIVDSFIKKKHELTASAHASLWVKGIRIYEADFSVRLIDKKYKKMRSQT